MGARCQSSAHGGFEIADIVESVGVLDQRNVQFHRLGEFIEQIDHRTHIGEDLEDRFRHQPVGLFHQKSREYGVAGEQTGTAGGDSFHQILEHNGEGCLAMGRQGVHIQSQPFHYHHVAGVQMTAAPVGGGVANALPHSTPRFIGCQFHPLGVDGKFLPAEFLAHALCTVGQVVADSFPESDLAERL